MRGLVMLLLAGAWLAGCTDSPTGADAPEQAEEEEDPLAAPAPWQIGTWWRYSLTGTGQPITWVVTEDAGDTWIVDIDEPGFRFFHDAFAQISTVGAIGKSDLQGSQGTGPVRFLEFPLVENKTWDLTWDGSTWQAEVVDVAGATAEVQALNATGALRVIIYDADVGWFRSIAAYDANGTMEFAAEYVAGGEAYGGTYVRWDVHPRYEASMTPGQTLFGTFDVPEEAGELWYTVTAVCAPEGIEGDQGAWTLQVHPEDDSQAGFGHDGVCPEPFQEQGVLDPHPGSWGVTGASAGGRVDALFIPRTLQEMQL